MSHPCRIVPCALAVALAVSTAARCGDVGTVADDGFRFSAPGRFRIEQVADDRLAHDIFALTLDARGRVFVSGPGYIRRLIDRDGDGVFDATRDFCDDSAGRGAGPERGCQGMVFHDGALYTTGGQGLERYDDRDSDGVADGPPTLLLPLATGGEHTSHALRIGPDGRLWFLGGNYCRLPHDRVGAFSPVPHHYAGIFCRMTPSAERIEVWSQGMRNAYDFDFTPRGDAFGWDSDSERDEGLFWYRPCRVYHFTPGADCGWRSSGSGKIPTYAIESIAPAAEIHRGSPTGVACYRHRAFPARYHGGLFLLDWTHGRVYFVDPRPVGASYRAEPVETFLAAGGRVSFAPTDVDVAPDGSLLICSGGRGIAGSVYRVSAAPPRHANTSPVVSTTMTNVAAVLRADSPLSPWSRARWEPRARSLGVDAFVDVLEDSATPRRAPGRWTETEAVRALEIVVDLFGKSAKRAIDIAARSVFDAVRAQAARYAVDGGANDALVSLLSDRSPLVRRSAVEGAMRSLASGGDDIDALARRVLALADSRWRRERQAVIAALALLPPDRVPSAHTDGSRIVRGMALVLRTPRTTLNEAAVRLGLAVIADGADSELRLDAVRLVYAAFERLESDETPKHAAFDPAWDRVDLAPHAAIVREVLAAIEPLVAAADARIAREAGRLAGRLGSRAPAVVDAIVDGMTESSPASDDMMRLWLLARFKGPWADRVERRVADAGLALPAKIDAQSVARDGKWCVYQREIWERLLAGRPTLARRIVDDASFGDDEHLDLISGAPKELLASAAARLLDRPLPSDTAARRGVVDFASRHARRDPRLRALATELLDDDALRSRALALLARDPVAADRDAFLDALADANPLLVLPAVQGLERLARKTTSDAPGEATSDTAGDELLSLLVWAHRFDLSADRRKDRDVVARRIAMLLGANDAFEWKSTEPQGDALAAWARAFRTRFPNLAADLDDELDALADGDREIEKLVDRVRWDEGDATRGRAVFEIRSCGSCHPIGKGARLGPELAGVSQRYQGSLPALLAEIVVPDRIVPKRYQASEFILDDGERVEGLRVYSAGDALVVVTREGQYRRINPARLLQTSERTYSLMPGGLLAGLTDGEVADLIAFLRSL